MSTVPLLFLPYAYAQSAPNNVELDEFRADMLEAFVISGDVGTPGGGVFYDNALGPMEDCSARLIFSIW